MKKHAAVKTLAAVLALSVVLCASAYAQTDGAKPSAPGCMMMDEGMMSMMRQMMMGQGMMGQGMMMKDMMQMMMKMMDMQEKALAGVAPAEKAELMADMAGMREKMRSMMSTMSMMMGQPAGSEDLGCAEEWLKKAIDLHMIHLKDPKTATEPSQIEMMDQMEKAYGCLLKATGKSGAPRKTDPHGH